MRKTTYILACFTLLLFGSTDQNVAKQGAVQASFIENDGTPDDGKACHVHGKIKFVDYNADYEVEFVDYNGDLKVNYVDYNADSPGQWEVVDYGEDYTIEVVDYNGDFTVEEVDYGEGCD